jgi:Asp-tRNA(Asn)/Glu-tRNA(Gln) amidotransferase A subunit family amidase
LIVFGDTPVGIDEVDVEGYETGVGTNFINKGNPAKADAHFVALLRAKGAIIFGKSTMHEIGNFSATHDSRHSHRSVDVTI